MLMKERRKMDFKNLAYPFEDVGDAPFNVVRILNECYNDYSDGNLGDGERMAEWWYGKARIFKTHSTDWL